MKKTITAVVLVLGCVAYSEDVATQVRSSVSTVVSLLPEGQRGSAAHMREFGFPLKGHSAYKDLVGLVSSNQLVVCENFAVCATNELARMVLLAAWWGGDEALYMSGLSNSLDLATSGVVSRDEFDWYRKGHRNMRRGSVLSLRYEEPGVSNLALRIFGYTCDTNAYRRIVSEESRASLANFLEEISHTKQNAK